MNMKLIYIEALLQFIIISEGLVFHSRFRTQKKWGNMFAIHQNKWACWPRFSTPSLVLLLRMWKAYRRARNVYFEKLNYKEWLKWLKVEKFKRFHGLSVQTLRGFKLFYRTSPCPYFVIDRPLRNLHFSTPCELIQETKRISRKVRRLLQNVVLQYNYTLMHFLKIKVVHCCKKNTPAHLSYDEIAVFVLNCGKFQQNNWKFLKVAL